MKQIVLYTFFLIYQVTAIAQNAKKWQSTFAVNFTSVPTLNISGTDSLFNNTLSIAPAISFRNISGLGIVYSPVFVTGGSNPGIFMHKINVGLEQYDKPRFDIVAEYSHFFFTGNPSIPTTPINNEIVLGTTYKKSWVRPKISAGIGFGTDKTSSSSSTAYDIELAAGLSHSFEWEVKNVNFSLSPSLLVNAGTNEYFSFLSLSKYISHTSKFNKVVKNYHARNNRGSSSSGPQTTTTNTSQSISLTNLELNLESSVDIGSFTLRPAGSIFTPLSGSSGGGLDGYWEITLSYNF